MLVNFFHLEYFTDHRQNVLLFIVRQFIQPLSRKTKESHFRSHCNGASFAILRLSRDWAHAL